MDIDLDALDRALPDKKSRKRDSSQPKSWRNLYDEAKRMARDYNDISSSSLYTRYEGITYSIDERGDLWRNYHCNSVQNRVEVDDIGEIPIQVFERLVANGGRKLKDYYEMVDKVIQGMPEIVLEANLEGKTTNKELLSYVYDKRLDQLNKIVRQRVKNPVDVTVHLCFSLWLEPPSGQDIKIIILWYSYVDRNISVQGVSPYLSNLDDMAKLVHFLTCFEQVVEKVRQRLDKIEIEKG